MPHYPKSQHPIIADMVSCLDDDLREFYEERSAIGQFDGTLDRALAEALALLEIAKRYGWPPKRQM